MAKRDCCWYCVYAWRDLCQLMAQFALGFPYRPSCANQPGHYGVPRPTPIGKVCLNYRPRPPEPTGKHVKRIILTNGMVAYVDAADHEELSRYTWSLVSGGYAGRREKRALVLMHRQIMNPPEGMQVDHIKGNRLDNTRAHLRVCTPWENAQNRAKHARATSRRIGVYYHAERKKWPAVIRIEGRRRQIGSYDDESEAARAYDYAAVLYHGDSAPLNFPEEWPPQRRAEVRAQQDAALVGANHDSPSSEPEDRIAHRATSDQGRATNRRESPRKPHNAKRKTKKDGRTRVTGHGSPATKKKSRAETQGRRGGKPKAKRSRSEGKKGKRRRATGP